MKLSYVIGGLSHSLFLTRRRGLWQNALRRKSVNGHKMKRYGVAFTPRVRGYSENISSATAGKLERAARQGYFRKGQKQLKEN
jgi:hypothetical protein